MYEHLRNDFLLELQKTLYFDEISKVLNALDKIIVDYEITRKSTELSVIEDDTPRLVRLYLSSKKLEGVSDNTIELYLGVLRLFFDAVTHQPQDIEINEIRLFLVEYQRHRGISDRTLDKYRQILNGFFGWCVDEGYMIKNPCKNIKEIKYEVKPRKSLTRFELERVRRSCKTKRELAIVDLLYSTGCRVSELVNMKFTDMNGTSIHIVGKGKKHNTVYLNTNAQISLNEYVNSRSDNSEYLFVSEYKPYTKISARTVQHIMRRISKELDIILTPHILRHTSATLALQNGMPITQVQKMLGHSSVNTTQIYAETTQEEVAISHRKCVI